MNVTHQTHASIFAGNRGSTIGKTVCSETSSPQQVVKLSLHYHTSNHMITFAYTFSKHFVNLTLLEQTWINNLASPICCYYCYYFWYY